jgi:hypothetical protein
MAITSSDIHWYLSGGSGNTDPNASLGGARSTTAWAGGVIRDLFDDVSGDENAASDVEYRCVFVRNEHATLTATAGKTWILSEVSGGTTLSIALTTSAKNTAAEGPVANENTAPTGPTFSAPTTKSAGITIPDLAPNDYIAVWIRRTAANTVAVNADGGTLRYEFDTTA